MVNYSFIIPHKNSSNLLSKCINSIPKRNDIQIIVIDDNSDPKMVDFNNFPGINEKCIEIIFSKEGKGAGYARNLGLKKAVGKWILFADADDYFTDNFIKYLDKYIDSEFDLIYFGIFRENKITEKKSNICGKYDRLMDDAINKKNHDEYKYTAYVPWGKMIKHSLIKENNILFDETFAANDRMFSLLSAYKAKNIHFDPNRIYTYVPENGIITKNRKIDSNLERCKVYVRSNVFLKSISKNKYKVNLFTSLFKLFRINNYKYFYEAVNYMKENKISIVNETFEYFIFFPVKLIKKFLYWRHY